MSVDDRTADLRARLERHEPRSPREERSLGLVLAHLAWLPRPFDEAADPTHVTTSAIVVDGGGRTLLHRHKRLGIWLQPGGHVDPGEQPADAVLREAVEETGLDVRLGPSGAQPVHVDVHEGGRGHLHLDIRYLLLAPPGSEPAPPAGESQQVRWFTEEEAVRRADPSFADALAAARDLR